MIKNTTVNPAHRTVTTIRNSKRYIKPCQERKKEYSRQIEEIKLQRDNLNNSYFSHVINLCSSHLEYHPEKLGFILRQLSLVLVNPRQFSSNPINLVNHRQISSAHIFLSTFDNAPAPTLVTPRQ